MNFRRGFFRFWIFASVIWFVSFGLGGASKVAEAISVWNGSAIVTISTDTEKFLFPVGTSPEQVEKTLLKVAAKNELIKRKIRLMIDQGAAEAEIDAYVASERTTPENLRTKLTDANVRADLKVKYVMEEGYLRDRANACEIASNNDPSRKLSKRLTLIR